jgi:hypothetical protein
MSRRALTQVACPTFAGHQRSHLVAPLAGRGCRRGKRTREIAARQRRVVRVDGRRHGVDHRLVVELRPSALANTLEAGAQCRSQLLRPRLRGRVERRRHPQEEGAVQRPRRAADGRDEGHPDRLADGPQVGIGHGVELGCHRCEAPVHVDAVIGIADLGVELGQLRLALVDPPREQVDETDQIGGRDVGHGRRHTPQRRAGVCTGASQ